MGGREGGGGWEGGWVGGQEVGGWEVRIPLVELKTPNFHFMVL